MFNHFFIYTFAQFKKLTLKSKTNLRSDIYTVVGIVNLVFACVIVFGKLSEGKILKRKLFWVFKFLKRLTGLRFLKYLKGR